MAGTGANVVKKYHKLAFGSAGPRFRARDPDPIGCDPCLYEPKPIALVYKRIHASSEKEPWRCKTELEEWSKNLGYRNQKIHANRKYMKTILGPAWHEVNELPVYEPACKNLSFGRVRRFKKPDPGYPGPGRYTRLVPYKAPYGPHSTRPTFEREEPCRFKDMTPKWCLAPNRYNYIDKNNIDQKSNKIVSLKGPYNLFSGKRDGTSIKNHFSTMGRVAAKTWPIALPGSMNGLDKSHFGQWNKTNRDLPYRGRNGASVLSCAPKKPSDPGPAHYSIQPEKEFSQCKYGFNSSYDREPGYVPFRIWPGVGRYKVRPLTCGLPGQGHKHVFLSKVQRTMGSYLPEKLNTF